MDYIYPEPMYYGKKAKGLWRK